MLYCKIQNLLHALRIVGYKRMIVMQISICHASWVFPSKITSSAQKCVLAKNCNWESWNKKSLRCNFKFINNKIMFMICKNTFKVHGTKRSRTFLLTAKDIFFKLCSISIMFVRTMQYINVPVAKYLLIPKQ